MIEASTPSFSLDEEQAIISALRTSKGIKRNQFQGLLSDQLKSYLRMAHCALFSSCTGGLDVLFSVLKEFAPQKKYVVVPVLSWVTTAEVVIANGLVPIFVDVDPKTGLISEASLQSTKDVLFQKSRDVLAVMVVHLFGDLVSSDLIIDLKDRFPDSYLIEDLAEGIGAQYDNGVSVGSYADFVALSFHATKLINAGQGGAILARDGDILKKVEVRGHHGINTDQTGKYYFSTELGKNYAWTDILAALAYSQFLVLEDLVGQRRSIAGQYRNAGIEKLGHFCWRESTVKQVYWLPWVSLDFNSEKQRDEFISICANKGVNLRPMFYPLVSMSVFARNSFNGDHPFTLAERFSYTTITLPTARVLADVQAEKVVGLLREAYDIQSADARGR